MKVFDFIPLEQRLLEKQSNEIFIIDTIGCDSYTYAEFFHNVESCIRILDENSIPKTVFVSMKNCYRMVVLYFACIATGRTISPIDPNMSINEISDIVQTISNSVLISDNSKLECDEYLYLSANCIDLQVHNLSEAGISTFLSKVKGLNFKTPCLITYTSGTSGKPKGVIHNLANLILSAEAFRKHLNIGPRNVFLHVMPMTYMAGILNTILLPFISGSSIVLSERFSIIEAAAFWKKVESTGANTFWLSPSMLAMLDKTDKDAYGREYCSTHDTVWLIGTAPLGLNLKMEFERKYKVKLYQSYGLSETLFVSSVNNNSHIKEDAGVGLLLEDVELEQRQDGEILIRVPWMFLGYTNESKDNYFAGESYISGDIGEFRSSSLYITDRKKDLIIRGGINISPKAIETIALNIKGILEAVVFKGQSPIMGETVICAVVIDSGYDSVEIKKELLNNARFIGTGYGIDKIVFVQEIPRNVNGKVDKKALVRLYDN